MKDSSKKIVLGSALTIVLSTCIICGSTLALFTAESKNDITIKSGKVNVVSTINDVQLYSALPTNQFVSQSVEETSSTKNIYYDENNDPYYSEILSSDTTFTCGGTFSVTNGNVALDKIVPGDKATFNITINNNSNVNVQYRLKINATGDKILTSGLEMKVGTNDFSKVEEYVSSWSLWLPTDTSSFTVPVKIALPLTAGNLYQNKTCGINFSVEAVQSNSYLTDGSLLKYVPVDTKKVLTGEDTYLEVGSKEVIQSETVYSTGYVDLLVPAYSYDDTEELTFQVEAIKYEQLPEDIQDDVTVQIDEVFTGYEATLVDQDGNNVIESSKWLTMRVYVGKNQTVEKVYHENNEIPQNDLTLDEIGYSYDSDTGFITIKTKSFSPYSIKLKRANIVDYSLYLDENYSNNETLKNKLAAKTSDYTAVLTAYSNDVYKSVDNEFIDRCVKLFDAPSIHEDDAASYYYDNLYRYYNTELNDNYTVDFVISFNKDVELDDVSLGGQFTGLAETDSFFIKFFNCPTNKVVGDDGKFIANKEYDVVSGYTNMGHMPYYLVRNLHAFSMGFKNNELDNDVIISVKIVMYETTLNASGIYEETGVSSVIRSFNYSVVSGLL